MSNKSKVKNSDLAIIVKEIKIITNRLNRVTSSLINRLTSLRVLVVFVALFLCCHLFLIGLVLHTPTAIKIAAIHAVAI